jgi:uncharacterized protein
MINSFQIGEVVEVRGTRAKILVDKDMNHSTFIYHGEVINNITVNAFIIIKQGVVDIVGKIDGEYISDLLHSHNEKEKDSRFTKGTINRILEVQIVGFIDTKFNNGIKRLPMIGNIAYIPNNHEILSIYSGNKQVTSIFEDVGNTTLTIGDTMFEDVPVEIPINAFFASHIGIFGNTGSGKSNTLTRLYNELFKKIPLQNFQGRSQFILIDFNGEYTKDTIFNIPKPQKELVCLSTIEDGMDKLIIREDILFNAEILSILFNATEQTQKPFINRVVKGMEWAKSKGFEIASWAPNILKNILTSLSPSKDALDLFKESISELFTTEEAEKLLDRLSDISWHGAVGRFYNESIFFNGGDLSEEQERLSGINECKQLMLEINNKGVFERLIFRFRLQLLSDLLKRHAQFEHINPLINRGKSRIKDLEKVIELIPGDESERGIGTSYSTILQVISLRDCSVEIKKLIPLLFAKMIFDRHKKNTKQEDINKTVHLIIDEAHNILSSQSNREAGEWKDYRLDLFEEIIKEGRKFGFFLTISSQRPADISSTIISQVHNFFIHRLVNNKDLELLDNTISTLDRVSKMAIPTLASGSCIITGTAFVMPIFANVKFIKEKEERPSSDNVDLLALWTQKNSAEREFNTSEESLNENREGYLLLE